MLNYTGFLVKILDNIKIGVSKGFARVPLNMKIKNK